MSSRPRSTLGRLLPKGRKNGVSGEISRDAEPLNYNGIAYSKIIEAWLDGVNLSNNRHNTLTELASHLRYLIGRNPKKITEVVMQQPWVQELSAEGEDVAGTVGSVMGWRYNQKMPEQLRRALDKVIVSSRQPLSWHLGRARP